VFTHRDAADLLPFLAALVTLSAGLFVKDAVTGRRPSQIAAAVGMGAVAVLAILAALAVNGLL
jgi:predicted anti-sigma-YlaC factor YlaD